MMHPVSDIMKTFLTGQRETYRAMGAKIPVWMEDGAEPCPGERVEVKPDEWTTLECVEGEVISKSVPDTWEAPGYDETRKCETCDGEGFIVD